MGLQELPEELRAGQCLGRAKERAPSSAPERRRSDMTAQNAWRRQSPLGGFHPSPGVQQTARWANLPLLQSCDRQESTRRRSFVQDERRARLPRTTSWDSRREPRDLHSQLKDAEAQTRQLEEQLLAARRAKARWEVVTWYCWCYAYLWNQPVESEKLEELLELAEQLMDLSFQSMELQGVLTENLSNPNATARQSLKLLSVLARFSHFPPEFKESCARVCSGQRESDLTSLSNEELVNAFNIHLCAVFDGPAALKHWFTEDDSMKLFFQVHTSQKWYQKQDFYRSMFRQSDAFMTLRDAAEKEGLDLRTSDAGEVYHLEFVSRDAKERLANLSEQPPLAVICITNKEQLRWYVPITEAGEELEKQNRCRQFHYMFKGAVQKVRHAQTMGYRPCIIWMSDWNELKTEEERRQYLKTATADYEAFRDAAEKEGLDLRTSDAGEAEERLADLSEQPPLAVICITNKEQLRWYVPITEAGEAGL
ncbi:unnamed protein product [Effrenium voratum]|nr:unnamed protein product [Effrenium voratum]